MLRFCANISLLFTELALRDRFEAAADAGFSAVEIQFPYALSAAQIKRQLQRHRLKLVQFNVAADKLLNGGEGLAAVPESQHRFRQAVDQALHYAAQLQPNVVNVLPGCCHRPERTKQYLETFKTNLRYAADAFAGIGVKTVLEAINTHDMPGFIVHSGAQMRSILADLDHPGLLMQYDLYHMQRMAEDCAGFLRDHIDKIGHIQFADCPGRGQPGTGSSRLEQFFRIIAGSGYRGWIGAEYRPAGPTTESLAWLGSYRHCGV